MVGKAVGVDVALVAYPYTGSPFLNIVEGGALYYSIAAVSGSGTGGYTTADKEFIPIDNYIVSMLVDYPLVQPNPISIKDNGMGGTPGWLYSFFTGSNVIEYLNVGNSNTIFYDKTGKSYQGPNIIKYSDTLFPIQKGDFIRIGIPSTYPVDINFPGFQLYNYNDKLNLVSSSSTNSFDPLLLSSIEPMLPGSNLDAVEFRMFRRIPNETFVLIENIPDYISRGLLIPYNFNPKFDPVEIARKIGLV